MEQGELLFLSSFKYPSLLWTLSAPDLKPIALDAPTTFKRSIDAADIVSSHCDLLNGSDTHDISPRTAAKHDVGEMMYAMVNQ